MRIEAKLSTSNPIHHHATNMAASANVRKLTSDVWSRCSHSALLSPHISERIWNRVDKGIDTSFSWESVLSWLVELVHSLHIMTESTVHSLLDVACSSFGQHSSLLILQRSSQASWVLLFFIRLPVHVVLMVCFASERWSTLGITGQSSQVCSLSRSAVRPWFFPFYYFPGGAYIATWVWYSDNHRFNNMLDCYWKVR